MSPKSSKFAAVLALTCLLFVTAPLHIRAEEDVDEKDVVVLMDKNFNKTLTKHKYALVEFYAPWCGHCKNQKPAYAQAATQVKKYDESILVAKVDATVETKVAGEFSIRGFPTIKWFVDGKESMDYGSGRTADEIVAWIKKRTGPPSTIVTSSAELKAAKENQVAMFGYFKSFDDEKDKHHAAFESLASKTDDAAFFKLSDASIAKELGISSAPGFVVARNYPEFGFEAVEGADHPAMKEDADKTEVADRLAAFLAAEKLPAFIEFNPTSASRIFGSGIVHQVIAVAPKKKLAPKTDLIKQLTKASSLTRGKVVWVTAALESEDSAPIINFFGLDKESSDPQIVGFNSQGSKKYALDEGKKITAENLAEFGLAVVDGTASKRVKSAPVPKQPTEDGVTVVVGSTFESIVKDPTKDVLLEVYAPWCGHCKSLAPTYAKLAKRFSKIPSVVIAKMDGTENEVPELDVQGYPTIIFFPAEDNASQVPYQGSRDLKGFTKFIKENAKVEYELPKKKKGSSSGAGDEETAGHEEL